MIVLGILFVLVFDPGAGLSSPGFWLIPAGLIGGLVVITRKKQAQARGKIQLKTLDIALIGAWLAAFFCIGGLYFGWSTEGFGAFIYLYPAIIFTVAGLVLLVIRLVRR